MTRHLLTLNPKSPALSDPVSPCAWFIPSPSPAVWLAQIVEWHVESQIPMPSLALLVVPESLRDRSPRGVLVVPESGVKPKRPGLALPYICRANRLFLPADATLFPPISDDEILAWINWDRAVMHPVTGLVGYAHADVLRVSDLIAPPPLGKTVWTLAQQGPPPLPRITSVEPEQPPTLQSVLDATQGNIGSKTPDQAPPDPDEKPPTTLDKVKNDLTEQLAKSMKWLFGGALGSLVGGALGASALAQWLDSKIKNSPAANELLRNKEIQRLLDLLATNPDEGLRYALPLGGLGKSRGEAPPSNVLPPRDTNFNLGRLGHARPGDSWQIQQDLRLQLTKRYRDAANREMRLGRYQRAAYIFAELLGDFSSAANALRQGKFFREAAVLYREKLRRPHEAAQCLLEGGLVLDAIELYKDLQEWVKVAELCERLEKTDEARIAWRREVERLHNGGSIVSAAKILEDKLQSPDESLAMLEAVGLVGTLAGPCLKARFELLERLGRHQAQQNLIQSLRGQTSLPTSEMLHVVGAISATAAATSNAQVRLRAADTIRVIVGRRLATANVLQSQQFLRDVRKLDSADKLLASDITRFLRPAAALPKLAGGKPNKATVSVLGELKLPPFPPYTSIPASLVQTHRVVFDADERFLWGVAAFDKRLEILCLSWADGHFLRFPHPSYIARPGSLPGVHILLTAGPALITLEGPQDHDFLPITDMPKFAGQVRPMRVGEPPGLPPGLVGWCAEGLQLWVITRHLTTPGVAWSFNIACHWMDGELVNQHEFHALEPVNGDYPPPWIPMIACNGDILFALGARLHCIPAGGSPIDHDLNTPVTAFRSTFIAGKPLVVAILEQGGVLILRNDKKSLQTFYFGRDLPNALMTFTLGGLLVATSGNLGRVYRVTPNLVTEAASFDSPSKNPLAILPGPTHDQFAIIDALGTIHRMRIQL